MDPSTKPLKRGPSGPFAVPGAICFPSRAEPALRLEPSHLLAVFARFSCLWVGCSNSPNEASSGAAGSAVDSSGGAAAGGASSSLHGASGNGASGHGAGGNGSGGLPSTHITGLVKLNLRVK